MSININRQWNKYLFLWEKDAIVNHKTYMIYDILSYDRLSSRSAGMWGSSESRLCENVPVPRRNEITEYTRTTRMPISVALIESSVAVTVEWHTHIRDRTYRSACIINFRSDDLSAARTTLTIPLSWLSSLRDIHNTHRHTFSRSRIYTMLITPGNY